MERPDAVKIHFRLTPDEDGHPPVAVESVWARPCPTPGEYVLDNVPFFAREATLGDTIRTREVDGQRWFDAVAHRSRNSLVRVVVFDRAAVESTRKQLTELGCTTEYLREHNVLAVSVPPEVRLTEVQRHFQAEASAGRLDYEEPLLRQ